ncbi:hypothetical protein G9A89_014384 [Geosiphon pyriformis]|nr:hypothetical protein G9A89_014384 [Geosiphon pyriformis]
MAYISIAKLEKFTEDASSSNIETNQKPLTSNILPATIMEDKSLAAIFLFELEESTTLLFSEAILNTKLITAIYINAKVDGHFIKLIHNNRSAGSIITRQFIDQLGHQINQAVSTRIITADRTIKTPIGEIDNLLIEVNSIIVPIKVLVMEATQYQILVGNDWLFKMNAMLDWTT